MKKDESPRINKNFFTVSIVFALGFIFLNSVEKITENIFNYKKKDFERNLSYYLDKRVDLGKFSGLKFFGFSIRKSKIFDYKVDGSHIQADNLSARIMPFKSLINRKWVFKINAHNLDFNIKKDFINLSNKSLGSQNKKNKFNYIFYLNLKDRSNIKINDLELDSKLNGNLVYKTFDNQLIGSFETYLKDQGKLYFKFNKKFNNEFFKFNIISKGLNLNNLNLNFSDSKVNLSNGFLKTNLTFHNSVNRSYCKGKLALYDLTLINRNLNQDLNSKSLILNCKNNQLLTNINEINYGTLISNIKLNIPLKKDINKIKINGSLGYLNSTNPEIKLLGNIPYQIGKNKIKFGVLDTNFILNRTQLSNLNFFRNNGIRGFITANGKLSGELNNLKTTINFNLDYPHFKGIRIREIWDGKIINQKDGYLLKMNNRYSPIPSFLSLKVDSKLKLRNLEFNRIFDSNKGSFKIIKDNDLYGWNANNFPLNELELSLQNNEFDRVDGTINGLGAISLDQSMFKGRFSLSSGKYRNIKFANSLFDFKFLDDNLTVNASLFPIDGGMIDTIYKSNNNKFLSVDLLNISTDWTALTLFDVFNFNKNKVISDGKSKDLKLIEIVNNQKTLDEQLNFLKRTINNKKISSNKKRINNFLRKFEGRYNAKLDIFGDKTASYKIKTNLQGYLREKGNMANLKNNNFSMDLSGGLFSSGVLKVSNLPLSLGNLFFDQSKDFKGNLDINLSYNLNEKSFSSVISSKEASINNFRISFDKGVIDFNDSLFNIDLSLMLDESFNALSLYGSIPINTKNELDLRLKGDQRFLELIGNLSNKKFTFKDGSSNLRMLIKGGINKPIANGFLFIKDAEVDIFKNNLDDINATLIFDFDQLEIKNFNATSDEIGTVSLDGSLPFYKELDKNKKSINFISKNFQLIGPNMNLSFDSNIFFKGSFFSPLISGNIGLKNGYINFKKNNNNENKIPKISSQSPKNKFWPELNWQRDREIEIISNESILNKNLFEENIPEFFGNINFDNLYINLGPDFRIEYATILKAYLDTRIDININGNLKENLNARGLIDIKKGRVNLYTTPFKLDKNQDNYILFASRNGITPYLDFSLTSKVPDTIIPISQNKKDINISDDSNSLDQSNGVGAFGIGNTRFIKIEASYKGFLDQLSFEDKNQMIQLRSTPNYSRTQIIGLIGGNSANLINRAFISQFNASDGFSERLQFSIYPALIENTESVKNIFSSETLDLNEEKEETENDGISSQAWIAEIGLDITDNINFAIQTTPDRKDIPPLWILTLQANEYLEILGSYDSNGDWKSQLQLFFRY